MRQRWLLLLDPVVVLAFAAIGRDTHERGSSIGGTLETAAPFLAATAAGWLVARAWRKPLALQTGLGVAGTTVALGMVIRRVAGRGTALPFVVVAALFLGGAMLAWRAAAARLAN